MKRTPLKRGTKQLKRTPLKAKKWPRWKKHTVRDWEGIALKLWYRAGSRCECVRDGERCKIRIKLEDVTAHNVHHAKKRSQGGKETLKDCKFACGPFQFWGEKDDSCHTWAENNPIEAKKIGW